MGQNGMFRCFFHVLYQKNRLFFLGGGINRLYLRMDKSGFSWNETGFDERECNLWTINYLYLMKNLKSFGVLCIAIPLLSSCQIYDVVKTATDKEEGRIVMKDGTEYVGRVRMPKANTQNVSIKTTDGKKLKLKNTDIAVLGVWKKTHTDKCHYLVCYPYKTTKMFSTKKEKKVKPQWMAVEAQGDHVEFYCCSYKYSIPKDGSLVITSVQNGDIFFVARKSGDETGCIIGYKGSGAKYWRTQLMKYLDDDPSLCAKLESKEVDPSDLQKIADLYDPTGK